MTNQDLYQQVTDQVLALMQSHGADWVKPWTGTGIPVNASTKAEYQGSNILMLGMAAFARGYETHHWATYPTSTSPVLSSITAMH